jgi:uncharacterized protein YerC
MVHISKRPLKKELVSKLFNQLAKLIAKSTNRSSAAFLKDLLTEAEQLMLAKRLAVILMMHEGYSPHRVCTILKMSSSTVFGMHDRYNDGDYNGVLALVGKSKTEREALWRAIERILRAGMPSTGKDRWQSLKQ